MMTWADINQAKYAGNGGKRPKYSDVKLPTPTAQDGKNFTLPPFQKERDSIPGYLLRNFTASSPSAKQGGQLNPDWVELLMGWPKGWTSLEPMSKEHFQQWLDDMHSGAIIQKFQDGSWEHETPRTGTNIKNIGARLRSIGNGQYPYSEMAGWEILS
jgi:hypothetical protein